MKNDTPNTLQGLTVPVSDAAKLAAISKALEGYDRALAARTHGVVAMSAALAEIRAVVDPEGFA